MRLSKIRNTLSKIRKPAFTGAITVAITVAIAVAIASILFHTNTIESYINPDDAFGFAFVEGNGLKTTTGGEGGKRYEINGDVDEFRDLCDDLRDDNEPSIIILKGTFEFEKGASNAELPSNCTIYGENCSIVGKFEIKNQSNIIIQNIYFKDSTKFGESHDNIIIESGSHHIWVDHCTFTKTLDGLLDIKRASSYITVSWCEFGKDHNKTMLIGHSDDHDDDIGNLKVTLHHNIFEGDSRNPRVRYGIVHVINNYYHNIRNYGIASVMNATVFAQNNYFEDVDDPLEVNLDDKYDSDEEGVIYNIGNIGVDEESDNKDKLEELPYSNYPVDDVKKVKDIVKKGAGVRNVKYGDMPDTDRKDPSQSTPIKEIVKGDFKTSKTKKILIVVASAIFVLMLILLIYVITKKIGATSSIVGNTPELY